MSHCLLRKVSVAWSLCILKQVDVQGSVCLNPIQIQKVHYLVRGKIMLIMCVCHTVKRTRLCSCIESLKILYGVVMVVDCMKLYYGSWSD